MPKTYAGIYQEYLKTCEKQGGTFSPNTLRSDFIKNGFEVKNLNSFERLVLFMDYLSDGFPDLAKKFNAQLQIDHLGEYGPMQEKAMMMMLEENIIHSNTDFINEVLVDPEVEKHFRDKGLQNLYETTAAMIGGKELEQLKNKDKKEPEISADRERQPEPRPDTGEKREEKEPDPARQDLTKAPVEKAPEQPAAAERQPDRKSEDMERQAALLREENLSAGPNKHMIIENSVQDDPVQRRYYDDALKAALQRAGLTEQELRNNTAARIRQSRSQEFYNVVHCVGMARDTIRYDDKTLGGHLKGVADHCIRYLKKYPKVRSTQSGRDSYELALNLLATCADPNDPEVKACIDGVNAKRGAKPGTKNFIDLGDYGPDRLLGRKVPAGEHIKDLDKRIAEQLKRSKDKSLTPNDMLKAKYEANRLKVEKLYLKTAVTPSKAVYPDRIAEKTKELWSDKQLMNKLVAHQSEKEQAQIMREHLASETASVPQPKTTQKEKQQNGPVAGA